MIATRRDHDDCGATIVELPLAVGLLLLPIAMLVMSLPSWPERQTVATAAAKEAASIYANAPTPEEGALRAEAAVDQATTNHGLPAGAMRLTLRGDWCRGCTVTASVTVEIPALVVPFIGDVAAVDWTADSAARIDDYRSIGGDRP